MIAAVIALFALLGLLALYTGSKILTASFAVVAALAFMAKLEQGAGSIASKRGSQGKRSHA
ncbi:hypothetical protein [Pelagicoccus sp. SDUM812003]|uniref:hypothetical protein n=1 Tax=Pelagicoccus sp. SDUM812003 TaxID=3041267 RepID=UPI00280D2E4E|nr:hypothetical protein [Pelagicoccus sp. SDUM812003]MDQ8201693.1 hypothetical protein [Pelagicoccus sp. SDUM812003]